MKFVYGKGVVLMIYWYSETYLGNIWSDLQGS